MLTAEAAWNTRDLERVAALRKDLGSFNDNGIAAADRRFFGPRPDGDTSGLPLR